MATYKVIQDIEAEDHILGPLSLRQFIYALIGLFFYYLSFISVSKHAIFFLVVLLPPALFCTFFALPLGGDQPTEVWALAKIRFFFKPRQRIWNQSGIKDLVTITVPKRVEVQLTDGLTQTEVKSRLKALADTIDTRGWAVKNVATSAYVRPGMLAQQGNEDRLLSITSMPQPVPDYDVETDVLDEQASPIAQQFASMIQTSTTQHRQQLLDNLADQTSKQKPRTQWFSRKATGPQAIVSAPQPQALPAAAPIDETASSVLESGRLRKQAAEEAQSHLQHVSPIAPQPVAITPIPAAQTPVTEGPDPAIINLAKRNDLNVSTLAREASKAKGLDDDQEVVISLR